MTRCPSYSDLRPSDAWWDRPVWLFDQGRTFLFENDRFAPDQSYGATYEQLGGGSLSHEEVQHLIDALYRRMVAHYRDARGSDRFPSLERVLRSLPTASPLLPDEVERLVAVFAEHECGTIPDDCAHFLRQCARVRRVGLISNIWSPCDRFEAAHGDAGLDGVFEHRIWSASFGPIKPSLRIFREALRCFGVKPADAVYIGDNHARDVVPAKELGLAAVWVNPEREPVPDAGPQPDAEIRHLSELRLWLELPEGR